MTKLQNHSSAEQLDAKYRRLRDMLGSHNKVVVAYSGGVDSTFLLKAAIDCLGKQNVLACIGVSESLSQNEYRQALEIARQLSANVKEVHPKELTDDDYRNNPPNRCYYCKAQLYRLLTEIAETHRYDAVLCGANADDSYDFRPGHQAAQQYSVENPLADAGLSKDDIRTLSKQLNLPTWDKPAQPCLASRMAYGIEITTEKLKQIEHGEQFLREIGLQQLRVRHHDKLVRIEVPPEKIAELAKPDVRRKIVAFFKKLGFTYITLDLQGFRTGSANEVL